MKKLLYCTLLLMLPIGAFCCTPVDYTKVQSLLGFGWINKASIKNAVAHPGTYIIGSHESVKNFIGPFGFLYTKTSTPVTLFYDENNGTVIVVSISKETKVLPGRYVFKTLLVCMGLLIFAILIFYFLGKIDIELARMISVAASVLSFAVAVSTAVTQDIPNAKMLLLDALIIGLIWLLVRFLSQKKKKLKLA